METSDVELPLPGGGSVSLRPVTTADEEFLLKVYASTREAELTQFAWAEGQKELFVSWQFGLQRQEYDTRFPDAEYYLIMIDGQPAGRIWIGRDSEQIRLLDIALLPEFQNRGAGTLHQLEAVDALFVDRWNRLHPNEKPRVPYVSTVLGSKGGPIIVATDWMKASSSTTGSRSGSGK